MITFSVHTEGCGREGVDDDTNRRNLSWRYATFRVIGDFQAYLPRN